MDNNSLALAAKAIINRPIRWSIAIVAIALIFSLSVSTTVRSVYDLAAEYQKSVTTDLQLASIRTSLQNSNQPAVTSAIESNRIIVKYKDEATLPPGLSVAAEHANLEKAQGLTKVLTINGIGAEVYQVSEDDTAREVVDRLMMQSGDVIEYAEVDLKVSPTYIPNDSNFSSGWHYNKIESPAAWDASQGEGVVVAIADTGVDCTHPDLKINCVNGWNVESNNADTTDIYGHGTAVAGAVAEVGDNLVGSMGVAYKAKIMPVRITDDPNGYAYCSAIANAATYAADHGAKIVSNSYGGWTCSSVQSAADYLRAKGGVFVGAAGNSSVDMTGTYPNPSMITVVSATNQNDEIASWSNYGAPIDVSAPGVSIYSTNRGGGYGYWSGTSLATPVTSAVYALIFAANPALTPNQADNILFSSANDLDTPGWDMRYGYGRVNANKAVAAAMATVGTRDSVPPSVPANVRMTTVTDTSVSLAWSASTDDNSGVAGYSVYRDGTKLTTVAGTPYTNSGLSPNTSYTYTVRAEDVQGNVSAESLPVSTTTADVAFGISAYSVPQKSASDATVAVVLTKAGAVTVRYGVAVGELTATVQSSTSTLTHTLNLAGLSANTTYYYEVVATDGVQSVTAPVSTFKTSRSSKTSGGGGKPRR